MTRTITTRSLGVSALTAVVAAPLFAVLAATPAQAASTAEIVGGRERIKVSVTADDKADRCVYTLANEAAFLVDIGAGDTESRVFETSAGTKKVTVECANGLKKEAEVQVGQADVLLDLVDLGLSSAGSSALTTDPTKR